MRIFVVHVGELIHFIAHFDHEIRCGIVVVSSQGLFDLGEDGQALFGVAA